MSAFMDMSQSMRMRQHLSLQQAQAMKMLQSAAPALRQLIKNELDTNPLLEADYRDSPETSIDAEREDWQNAADGNDNFNSFDSAADSTADFDAEPFRDADAFDYAPASADLSASSSADPSAAPDADAATSGAAGDFTDLAKIDDLDYLYSDGDNNEYNPALDERRQFAYDSIRASESLHDDLEKQLDFLQLPPSPRALAAEIIGSLDGSGYLAAPLAEIAQAVPNATLADAESALATVQQNLEPAGLAARGLAECLLLQLQRQSLDDTLAADILRGDLELLERRDIEKIAEQQNATPAEVRLALQEIARLDPAPGASVAPADPQYVAPEIHVWKNPETGRWEAVLATLAELQIPALKIADLPPPDKKSAAELRAWFAQKKADARALIYAVEERQKTLLKVSRETIACQQQFFETGSMSDLKPLTMTQIAEELGFNESTVTRAVSEKYGTWPGGIFELRKLFTTGALAAGDAIISNHRVKETIKKMIADENKRAPLSDQAIADALQKSGIQIARRTVLKYRESLRIPASRDRKHQ